MLFAYPLAPHVRRHGPRGYRRYEKFKPWLRDEFAFRCVFCLMRERRYPNGQAAFGVDHLVPQVLALDRQVDYENLVYACSRCNSFEGDAYPILDPCREVYGTHLQVNEDGTITGLTQDGRKLIRILRLDQHEYVRVRRELLQTIRILNGVNSPDARQILNDLLGFPNDLPDLRRCRPPSGNTRPHGARTCYFAQREQGILPATY
jgi:hypothetical protein